MGRTPVTPKTGKSPSKPNSSGKSKGTGKQGSPMAKKPHVTPNPNAGKDTDTNAEKPPASTPQTEESDKVNSEKEEEDPPIARKKKPKANQSEEAEEEEEKTEKLFDESSSSSSEGEDDSVVSVMTNPGLTESTVKAQLGKAQYVERLRAELPNIKWEIDDEKCKNFFHLRDALEGLFQTNRGWNRLLYIKDNYGNRYNIFTEFVDVSPETMSVANKIRLKECSKETNNILFCYSNAFHEQLMEHLPDNIQRDYGPNCRMLSACGWKDGSVLWLQISRRFFPNATTFKHHVTAHLNSLTLSKYHGHDADFIHGYNTYMKLMGSDDTNQKHYITKFLTILYSKSKNEFVKVWAKQTCIAFTQIQNMDGGYELTVDETRLLKWKWKDYYQKAKLVLQSSQTHMTNHPSSPAAPDMQAMFAAGSDARKTMDKVLFPIAEQLIGIGNRLEDLAAEVKAIKKGSGGPPQQKPKPKTSAKPTKEMYADLRKAPWLEVAPAEDDPTTVETSLGNQICKVHWCAFCKNWNMSHSTTEHQTSRKAPKRGGRVNSPGGQLKPKPYKKPRNHNNRDRQGTGNTHSGGQSDGDTARAFMAQCWDNAGAASADSQGAPKEG